MDQGKIMGITMEEIAQLCNVSRGTVDRALNNRPGINEGTRKRILAVAKEHNYRPHLLAASLSKGITYSIGLVVFDLKNQYFSQISNVISKEATEDGYFTFIAVSEKDAERESQILDNFASRKVDGVILLPITQGLKYVQHLSSLNTPIVTIVNQLAGIPHVHIDDKIAAYDSVKYIHEKGYQRICFICTPLRKKMTSDCSLNMSSQELRLEGVAKYMQENPEIEYTTIFDKDFCEIAEEIIVGGNGRSAFLCSSDVHAIQLLMYLVKRNYSIPGRVGVMGFDNLNILSLIRPRLTTMSTSIEEVGITALHTLMALINGEPIPAVQYVSHRIIDGETL
nr:LacI family DNA-binding transcriptional regulator [uncultured Sphaerochaeta sp.]